MEYLDFEKPLEELNEQLKKIEQLGSENSLDVQKNIKELKSTIQKTKKNIYSNLSPWQKVQLSRHPSRPYTLDYINNLTSSIIISIVPILLVMMGYIFLTATLRDAND